MRLDFLSWNLRSSNQPSILDFISTLHWNVAAFQECTTATARALAERYAGSEVLSGSTLGLSISHEAYQQNSFGSVLVVRAGITVERSGLVLSPIEAGAAPSSLPAPSRTAWAEVSVPDGNRLLVVAAHAPHSGASSGAQRRFEVGRKRSFYVALEQFLRARRCPAILGIDANLWIDDTPGLFDHPRPKPGDHADLNGFVIDGKSRHGLADVLRTYLEARPAELAAIEMERPRGPLAITHYRGRGRVRTAERFDAVLASEEFTVGQVIHDYEASRAAGSDHSYVLATLDL